MPNVTFYIRADGMPCDAALDALTERCAGLCTDILQAEPERVHVIHVPVRHGRGQPVFAEIRYRAGPLRTAAVMDRFMAGLDRAVRQTTGFKARIRCFGFAASSLHARN